jgi:hypothetical protein
LPNADFSDENTSPTRPYITENRTVMPRRLPNRDLRTFDSALSAYTVV